MRISPVIPSFGAVHSHSLPGLEWRQFVYLKIPNMIFILLRPKSRVSTTVCSGALCDEWCERSLREALCSWVRLWSSYSPWLTYEIVVYSLCRWLSNTAGCVQYRFCISESHQLCCIWTIGLENWTTGLENQWDARAGSLYSNLWLLVHFSQRNNRTRFTSKPS